MKQAAAAATLRFHTLLSFMFLPTLWSLDAATARVKAI
jgi:hypothetical protein